MIAKLCKKIWKKMELNTLEAEPHLSIFAIFLLSGYVLYYFFNSLIAAPHNSENVSLRLVVGGLSLIILLRQKLPNFLKKYFPLIWHFTMLYAFTFFFIYMLCNNPTSGIWQVNGLVGLSVLTWFVDFISFVVISILGISLAILSYMVVNNTYIIPEGLLGVIGSYSAPLIFYFVFSTKREKIYQEKINTMKALAGIVAHEMRTPLAGIDAASRGISKYLPTFLKTYSLAKNNDLISEEIANLELVKLLPENISRLTRGANLVIDMMLMRMRQIDKHNIDDICSINKCIEEALTQYPCSDEERDFINYKDDNDFQFKGNEQLIIHVLFNLLKNAIYYVRAAGKGNIIISTEIGEKYNFLYFEDTGTGISAKAMKNLFQPFNTDTRHGTGLGLAFCKEVMEKIGGQITCDSKKDHYTKFTLKFPKLKEE